MKKEISTAASESLSPDPKTPRPVVKPLTKERFEALCRVRLPVACYVCTEIEWYADEKERVLGLLAIDNADHDWSWMVLGRDEAGLFRAIDFGVSLPTEEAARTVLVAKLQEHSATGERIFPQGDSKKRESIDLFALKVHPSSLNPNYVILSNGAHHSAARQIMQELARAFIDVDGNFLQDFQTTGFNARLWELYISAFLYEQRFAVCREFDRPDYYVRKGSVQLGIEVTTVNPTDGEPLLKARDEAELTLLRQEYMPIKYGSALLSKMQKRYWELPHMKDKPFTLAIHDFCGDDSMTWSAPSIEEYLFGVRASWNRDANGILHVTEHPISEHRWKDKVINSGFFNQPEARHVSAVLFSNSATLSKFNRMGKLAGFGDPAVEMMRIGVKHDFNPNATELIPFSSEVKVGTYSENWTEGVRVFHNPNALLPIPPEIIENCAHHYFEDGRRYAVLPEGFIHTSHTVVLAPENKIKD